MRSAHLKKLINLARQNFTLKKCFKALIFYLKAKRIMLPIPACLNF